MITVERIAGTKDMQIPTQFFTITSFGTLAGSVAFVWVATSALGHVMPVDISLRYKKYISLVLAFVSAFVATSLLSDKTALTWLLAFGNGCLIYLTAVGLNSVTKTSPQAEIIERPTDPLRDPNREAALEAFKKLKESGAPVGRAGAGPSEFSLPWWVRIIPIDRGHFREPWY